jgi:hypothetical protein
MTTTTAIERRSPGRLLLAVGLLLPVLGVIGYVLQFRAQRLTFPWYMPIAATVGLLFVIASLWQARTVWRVLALLLVALLAGGEWALLLAMRLPAYTGPVAAGQPLPAFTTARADDTPFTQDDLKGSQTSVLVFFRGRW